MTQQPLADEVKAHIEQLQRLLIALRPEVRKLLEHGGEEFEGILLAEVTVWLAVQELSESSKRLEKATGRLVLFTWALFFITALLFAIELLRYLGYLPTGR